MSALGKILGTAGKVASLGANVAAAPITVPLNALGVDTTPGYSVVNIAKTQAGKIGNIGNKSKAATPANPYANGNVATWGTGVGSGPYSGSGASSYDPVAAQQDALAGQLRTQVAQKIQAIQQAYDVLNAAVDTSSADKANSLRQNYGQQTSALGDTYKDTANQLTGAYAGRGLSDSSFAGNAQDSATKTYNNNLNAINQSENNDLASVGQYAQTAHAQYNAGKNGYGDTMANLGSYGAPDLQTLLGNLGQTQQQLGTEQAGLGTQGQYLQGINAIAPQQNGGSGQLQSQLQSVLSSAAPGFAKQAIGQGLINQASNGDPAQQSYWNQYFQQLQSTQGS